MALIICKKLDMRKQIRFVNAGTGSELKAALR